MTSSIKNLDTPGQLYGRSRPLKVVFELGSHQQHSHSGHLGRRHPGMQTSATQPDTCSDCLDLNINPAQVLCMHGASPRGLVSRFNEPVTCYLRVQVWVQHKLHNRVGWSGTTRNKTTSKLHKYLSWRYMVRSRCNIAKIPPSIHHIDSLSVEKRTNFHSCFIYIPPSLAAPHCLQCACRQPVGLELWHRPTLHRTALPRLRASIDSRGAHPGRSETQAVGHTVTLRGFLHQRGMVGSTPLPPPIGECRRSGPTQKPTSAKFDDDDDSPTTPGPLSQHPDPR